MYIVPSKILLIYVCFLKRWNKYLTTTTKDIKSGLYSSGTIPETEFSI